MPKAPRPQSKPMPKGPTGQPSGAPNAGAALDLDAYRTPAAAGAPTGRGQRPPTSTEQKEQRALRDKVSWDQLVGIPGLRIVDGWTDSDNDYGDYVGTVVRLPQMGSNAPRDVLVLTSASTRAGKFLTAKHAAGTFDLLDGSDGQSVGVAVRAKKSPNYPEGRPMVLLALVE